MRARRGVVLGVASDEGRRLVPLISCETHALVRTACPTLPTPTHTPPPRTHTHTPAHRYKTPDDKPINEFGYDEAWLNKAKAIEAIEETNGAWKGLRDGSIDAGKLWTGV